MKTIKTTAAINSDRHLSLQLPPDLPTGNYEVLIVLEPKSVENSEPAIEQAWQEWVQEVREMPLQKTSHPLDSVENDYETHLLEKYRDRGLEL